LGGSNTPATRSRNRPFGSAGLGLWLAAAHVDPAECCQGCGHAMEFTFKASAFSLEFRYYGLQQCLWHE
jgi:hypothetical protein